MEIQAFQFDNLLPQAIWQFDRDLYHADRGWIPPFRPLFLRLFDPEFGFYQDPLNRHCHFVASRSGHIVGHVSAFVNHTLRRNVGPVGLLGLFESVEDETIATSLFHEALHWLTTEHADQFVWAPVNFDIWHGYRLMTRGFDLEPFLGEPYNKPYYASYLEQFGFAACRRWHTVELMGSEPLTELADASERRFVEIQQKGYRFAEFDIRNQQQVKDLYAALISSYQGFFGFTAQPFHEFEQTVRGVWRMTDPRFASLVYDPDRKAAGFSIAYPDQSRPVRAMRGDIGWAGKLRFDWNRRDTNRAIFYMIGITAEEIARHHGLGRAVFHDTMQKFLRSRFRNVVLAIMAEDSPARSLVGRFLKSPSREYALFELR